MRLKNVMKRYRSTFVRDDGLRFLGELTSPAPDKVFLKVDPASMVAAGNVFGTEVGRHYLVLSRGESDLATTIYRLFELVEVDRKLAWSRMQKIVDPVTGLETDTVPVALGDVWVHIEKQDLITDITHIDERRYTVTTPVTLQVNDKLGDYTVVEVFFAYGVCQALVK
ncbi:hypothetical protein [Inquilinus limosus]|uniref:Uncharacterized protein n=1 Tax=Inquilinus limosus MP06 TaxID=1398085 RepID=A0A0A0DE07_9PROT|nr:hypothetical protein [Inquilinus limosus]KGM36133.1 hypothetical protein P409_00360 [Inquilinus limosus MP06]